MKVFDELLHSFPASLFDVVILGLLSSAKWDVRGQDRRDERGGKNWEADIVGGGLWVTFHLLVNVIEKSTNECLVDLCEKRKKSVNSKKTKRETVS